MVQQSSYKVHNLRFQGVLSTPNLWKGNSVFDLEQFKLTWSGKALNIIPLEYLRLGKLVERYLIYELQNQSQYQLLSENHQVQDNKLTIGELDCLLLENDRPIHLEIVYKFYLYDASVGTTQLDHWIGPNRRDSLIQKLTKLKNKQLPLLYDNLTKNHLASLGYQADNFKQNVCFKAQLFLPYEAQDIVINPLNIECIQGFYIHYSKLDVLRHCKFFIPEKTDWLMDVLIQIDWLTFTVFKIKIHNFITLKSAPLCWIKYPNGDTKKCFVVWW